MKGKLWIIFLAVALIMFVVVDAGLIAIFPTNPYPTYQKGGLLAGCLSCTWLCFKVLRVALKKPIR